MNGHFHFNRKSIFILWLLFLSRPPSLYPLQTPAQGTLYVYPSPATGDRAHVVYSMPGSGTCFLWVYNEAGDLVFQTQEKKLPGIEKTTLNLFYYHKGIYLCRGMLELDSGDKVNLKAFKFMVIK